MSAVAFVNTAWRTHQEASKDRTGSICLLIKTREILGERRWIGEKMGVFKSMQNGRRTAPPCLGQG